MTQMDSVTHFVWYYYMSRYCKMSILSDAWCRDQA